MKNNEPAFPIMIDKEDSVEWHYGMTLRDWFAGQALTGLLAQGLKNHELGEDATFEWYSSCAYFMADTMIAERDK